MIALWTERKPTKRKHQKNCGDTDICLSDTTSLESSVTSALRILRIRHGIHDRGHRDVKHCLSQCGQAVASAKESFVAWREFAGTPQIFDESDPIGQRCHPSG